jgi:hypothetical protein
MSLSPTQLGPDGASLIDVLDRVLNKGMAIDTWVRVALGGLDLISRGAGCGRLHTSRTGDLWQD